MAIADIFIRIVTKGSELAKRQMNDLGNSSNKTGGKLSKLSGVMKGAVALGAVALAKGLFEATQEFIAFDDKMTQSLAIMDTTIDQQRRMEEQALATSRTTRISAEQSAEAFFFLASAGLDAEQSIKALPQVAKFAQAGMFDMATATDLATDAQSALGLASDDAQQNLTNLTRVTDVLVKANTLANASVQQFSEALTNKAGSALKVTNKSIEEGVAVLSALADRGVKGAEAGEKLNQVLRDIPRATAKNSEEFAKLGLNMFDTEGNMKNVADIVEELDRVLGPMSDELKASTLDQLGLNRGVADAVKILSGAGDQIREYEKALLSSGGTTEKVADKQMGSLSAQIDLMKNAFSELGIVIGSIIAPALTKIVKSITSVTQSFTSLAKKTDEYLKQNEEVQAVTKDTIYGIEQSTKSYDKYTQAIEETTQANKDYDKSALDILGEEIEVEKRRSRNNDLLGRIQNTYSDYEEVIVDSTDALEEMTEEQVKQAKEMKDKALPTLNKVVSAYQTLLDIEKDQQELLKDQREAQTKVTKSEEDLNKAIENTEVLQEALTLAQEEAVKVTNQEKLAIEQLKESIKDLEEEEEKTTVTELKLAVAKERLIELEKASEGATRESEQAQNDYNKALEEVTRAEEDLADAQADLNEATRDYNEAIAKTPQNLLEVAIAQKELQDAIADVESLGIFEEALSQMVTNAGGQLNDLRGFFNALFSGQNIPAPSFGGGGGTPPSTPGKTNTSEESDVEEVVQDIVDQSLSTSEEALQNILNDPRFDGAKSGVTTIVNIQNKIEGEFNADEVAVKVLEAQRKGIDVIL